MTYKYLASLAFLTIAASTAWAETTITVENAKAFETAATAMSGGGFMDIINTGEDDRLLEVRADFPKVDLHMTEFTDGVARMMHVDGVPVPAGETVSLAPGGLHVMFMGLNGDPLEEGETIPATLIFEKAGEVEVTFVVVKREMPASN